MFLGCDGGESGVCSGEPILCEQVDSVSACGVQRGCSIGSACQGARTSCDTYPLEESCNADAGCQWGSCENFPAGCAALSMGPCQANQNCEYVNSECGIAEGVDCTSSDIARCDGLFFCEWNPGGSGICGTLPSHVDCSDISLGSCDPVTHPGCILLSEVCSGVPAECGTVNTEQSCIAQSGCLWTEG